MGFDSTFSGSLHPSRSLPDEVAMRLERSDADIRVMRDGDDADGEPGDVVPASRFMHGYDIPHDVLKLQRALGKYGITLDGSIERIGDGGGYFELTEVKGGKVYVRTGEIAYGKARCVKLEEIRRYAVAVYSGDAGFAALAGWLEVVPDPDMAGRMKYALRQRRDAEPTGVKPPQDVAYFIDRRVAEKAAAEFDLAGHFCKVIRWEEGL